MDWVFPSVQNSMRKFKIISTIRGSDQYSISVATLECGHKRSTLKLVGEEESCMECDLREWKKNKACEARFDGYIASDKPLELKQVLFIASHRCVVEELMTRETWEAERTNPNRLSKKEFVPGFAAERSANVLPSAPPESGFFYGINWLPEE